MPTDQDARRIRLMGHIAIKTKRNGASVTLLEMNGADAVVEFTMPKVLSQGA